MAGKDFASKNVGVLALQGDVPLHIATLRRFGIEPVLVKLPGQLKGLDGLIIPGGESTALLRLSEPIGMLPAITKFAKAGGHIFGTCAGAILLAKTVIDPAQTSLGLIDITVQRNGYGRQSDSRETTGQGHPPLSRKLLPLTFIRAPRINRLGTGVKTLVTYHDEPVLVTQGNILAGSFHPELDSDDTVYRYWLTRL